MSILVSAHGFEITQALKDACEAETSERLSPLALHTLKTRWTLSQEREEQIAHIIWDDGSFHGDTTVKTNDMYSSIHQCAKKAAEQMKKSHDKKQSHHKNSRDDFNEA